MARKTVQVEIPENMDDLVTLLEGILLKNDGVLPALPGQPATTPNGGANALPENEIAKPLRALYPTLKQEYNELLAARAIVVSRTDSVQQKLGLGDGQNRGTDGTVLNLATRALKVLLALYSGRENEAETWGFNVTTGEAKMPQRKTETPK